MDGYLQIFLQQFQHLRIQLEEIKSATNNFDDQNNCIGIGGFGKVYKGEVSHSKGRSMAAIKRLDTKHGQGIPEFLKEITMLSNYKHENLISLLGFCCEGPEMILVYEHASRGSLDRHLNSDNLTWIQRLKICVDVAKGLSYLHDPRGTHQRLIHCDVKSANILLDDHWNAKVADFGLSIMGPANEQQSVIVTIAAGTPGYCDPQYAMTHTLTKESDIYSLGVVMFEVLCGTLCCTYANGRVLQKLVPMWIDSYKQKKLNDISFKNPKIQPLDQSALEIFSDIAYRCLEVSREDRPKMAEVVVQLESAIEKIYESEEMMIYTMNYRSNAELMQLLSKGVLLNKGKTWFSLNKKGEHYEMRSCTDCVVYTYYGPTSSGMECNSRFVGGAYYFINYRGLETRVETKFLSPGIVYSVNLVFKFGLPMQKEVKGHEHMIFSYRLKEERYDERSYLVYERKDGWWICELYQFTCDNRIVDLEILFERFHHDNKFIEAEGIEFCPLEKVEHYKDETQPNILDSDANWEERLPTDYESIIEWSINPVQWIAKKEAYSIIRNGFLIDDGKKWFYLDKNGKKCLMLSAGYVFRSYVTSLLPLPESRFGEAIQCDVDRNKLTMNINIQSQLLSSETTYAIYLVYKLPEDQSKHCIPFKVQDLNKKDLGIEDEFWYIYLASPQIPVIKPKAHQSTHNPSNCPKQLKGFHHERSDGWTEVQIWEFHKTATTTEMISMRFQASSCYYDTFSGVIIQGTELRPI